uniref:Uncharacterized protein n=1 Tax=Cyprinus carpio carpio TaxID=630221 RepID=A0A9J8B8Y0_CYPCA
MLQTFLKLSLTNLKLILKHIVRDSDPTVSRRAETLKELQVRRKDLYIEDQIVLEQFLKLFNPDTRMWVKQNNPTSPRQAAELAETFMAARRSVYQPRHWRHNNSSASGKSADGFGCEINNSITYTHVSQTKPLGNTSKQQTAVKQHKIRPSLPNCVAKLLQGHDEYTCSVCGVSTFSLARLSKHMQFHDRDRPFPCELCGKRFSSRSHHTEHQRVHTGARPYTCDRCEWAFTTRHNLKRHQLVHDKKETYSCNVCGLLFFLLVHVLQVQNIKRKGAKERFETVHF